MQIVLHVIAGPATGHRWSLRSGQVARIGRTARADFSVPNDGQLADVQFTVECRPQECVLRDARDTLVNGQPAATVVLQHGDRIAAGQTVLAVHVEGARPAAATPSITSVSPAAAGAAAPPAAASMSWALVPLSAEARPLLAGDPPPRQVLEQLESRQLRWDAIALLAFWLPKTAAVLWAAGIVRKMVGPRLKPLDLEALAAAEKWAAEPTEDHRRLAEDACSATNFASAASWVAAAAFWSSGSLVPAGLPEVPCPPDGTGTAVYGALQKAIASASALELDEHLDRVIAAGKQGLT